MDEGKPAGPRAKWWSRPAQGRPDPVADPEAGPAEPEFRDPAPAAPEHGPGTRPDAEAPQPDAAAPPGGPGLPADEPQDRIPESETGERSAALPDPTPENPFETPGTGRSAAGQGDPEPAEAPQGGGFGEGRAKPLHDPDPYGTPPYGGPGPWAPAPPVQRPTPAEDLHVPPGFGDERGPLPTSQTAQVPQAPQAPQAPPVPHRAPPVPHPAPPAARPPVPQQPAAQPQPHPHPHPYAGPAQHPGAPQPASSPGAPPTYPESQWLQYDPWSAAPPQALTYAGEPPRKRRRGGMFVGALVIALVAGGIGGGVGAYVERNDGFGGGSVRLPQSGKAPTDRAPDTVAGIAASALPSVVTLHVSGSSGKGTGTGFVLDSKGHILTNNHVVDPAGTNGVISLTFSSGETARAKLVGKDSGYDLAVVKVTGVSGMKPLPLGNSDNVRVGDPVVAIGAPFDLQNTVTAGIISAKQRPITAGGEKGDGSDVSYVDALQTDAPINPGNSGGPLVDSQARVIGVNSAIRGSDNGGLDGGQAGSIGLGFAIPINQAKRVAEELISTGKATHPVIGVSLDMKFTGDGAKVGAKGADDAPAVTPNGPGAKAGIKPGDVITKIDGQRVHSGEELIVKIRSRRPGERMGLTVERDGKERDVTLVLGSAGDS
ncbi:trypsin-like peptidase domain-containing protein [Streptomyces sp. NBC_00237]|uniref:S1C family serine protease n=1 Tax=Streptomyces sp. NBC_00237 TaxID=2975687 RepID=UPI0022568A08|nr:trypsin-like peptidase domain-containing protein [Streptomyces sp. NBC_00237]MCX5204403.1 trypsin-like peptidase domain-containing protein [Streptomyces sp. NBC_00237]